MTTEDSLSDNNKIHFFSLFEISIFQLSLSKIALIDNCVDVGSKKMVGQN